MTSVADITLRVLTGLFIMTAFMLPLDVCASNSAVDMELFTGEGHTIFALTLEQRPKYTLKPLNKKKLLLSFSETQKSPELIEKLFKEKYLELIEDEQSPDLILLIDNRTPFYGIESSWIAEKRLFVVDITSKNDEAGMIEPEAKNILLLKNIRFGYKDNSTRMVMDLNGNPLWEMAYQDNKIVMTLEAESGDLKEKEYGPIKRLEQVSLLQRNDNELDISLKPVLHLDRVNIFRLEAGNRLVMDLYEGPAEVKESLLGHIPPYKKNLTRDNLDNVKPDAINNVVRMKIPSKPGNYSTKPLGEVNTAGTKEKEQTTIEPRVDYISAHGTGTNDTVNGLSPDEAFMFGRIQQAMEISDYAKGISLTNQFIEQYPDSPLTEDIAFLRGDFYYHLWRKGDTDVAGKVVAAYQYAIDYFGNSDRVPFAYIKMAQVTSLMEDSYPAVGYLSLVLTKKEGDFIPLAYLTRGKVFLRMDQPGKAIKDFQVLLNRYPDSRYSTEAGFWIAYYYQNMGIYEEAEKKLDQVSSSNPEIYLDYPEYLLLRAKNYLYLKKYDQARNYLFKAINIGHQPEGTDLLLSRIGDTYHHQGKEKDAEKYYRMVVDYYPDSEGSYISRLRLANYFSDTKILEDINDKNGSEPIGELAVLEKASQLYKEGQYREAMGTLQGLISKQIMTETRKEAARLYYNAAEKEIERLYKNKEQKALVEFYQSNKKKLADNIKPEVTFLAAMASHGLNQYEKAVSTFQMIKPYDLKPQSRGAYYYFLADSYLGQGDSGGAIKLIQESQKEELESRERQRLNLLLADIYKDEGRAREALRLYQWVVNDKEQATFDEIANAYLSIGKIFNNRDKYEDARRALNKCIDTASNNNMSDEILQSAYIELGKVLNNQGKYLYAAKAFERGFDLGYSTDNPDYWENRFRFANSYLRSGKISEAETLFNEIIVEGNSTILQQRAELKLGSLNLKSQLKQLSINRE